MSNDPRNKEQNSKIELTPEQSDPGRARAEDFAVMPNTNVPATPIHGQQGANAGERRRLLNEAYPVLGQPTPERNRVPDAKRA